MSRLRQQRRGKGSPTYTNYRKGYHLTYPSDITKETYTIIQLLHDGSRSAPVVKCRTNTGIIFYNIGVVKVATGQVFTPDSVENGAIRYVKDLAGANRGYICNIELHKGQGAKLAKAAGCYAQILKVEEAYVVIRLGTRILKLDPLCLATAGIAGAGGATLKPGLKAGASVIRYKARSKKAITVSAKNKNHHEHPYGGSKSKSPGRPKTVSRHAPPGAKVGSIAAKRTGRKSKK